MTRPEGRAFWASGWLWFGLALVSVLPFVVAPLPMMPDHFNHVARYHIMLEHGRSAFLARYYSLDWIIMGNLGVDLLMIPLGRVLPVETASTLIVALIAPLTVAGIYLLARAVHGQVPATALLALMMIYTFSFLYGFENYRLALALALMCAAAWIRLADRAGWWRWGVMAPFSFLVWLVHVSGWGVMGLIVLGWELSRLPSGLGVRGLARALGQVFVRMLPLALPLALIPLWRQAAAGPGMTGYLPWRSKLRNVLEFLDAEVAWLDRGFVALLLLLGLWLMIRQWHGRNRAMTWAFGVLLSAYIVMPSYLFSSYFADIRVLSAVGILFFLALPAIEGRKAQLVAALALALFGLRLTEISMGWVRRGAAMEAELAALVHVPRGARIAALSTEGHCDSFVLRGYEHLASYAITRRDAFVNTQWDDPGSQIVRPVYNLGHGFNDRLSVLVSRPRRWCFGETLETRLATLPRDRFDFVWMFGEQAQRPWLALVFEGPQGRLYRIVKAN